VAFKSFSMELYYTTNIDGSSAILPEEESFHCIKILRNKVQDKIFFTDGRGSMFEGLIKEANTKKVLVDIQKEERNFKQRAYYLHIAIAPTKNIDRTEFFIEKAVEIGIDEISFLKSERSERKEVKLERLQKIAISAMKQSKKAYLPVLNPMLTLKDFLKRDLDKSENYVASLGENNQAYLHDLSKNANQTILIGPEGDFSASEVDMCIQHNFKPLSLGESILRTETAGIFACAAISFINLKK
jgi:16S rRNA (uracil1498-N3)-methyltransferase